MPAAKYQPATLTRQGKTWLVSWYNHDPKTCSLERVRKTFNINRIRDTAERKRVALEIVAAINEALRNGYNYFIPLPAHADPPIRNARRPVTASNTTLIQALTLAHRARIIGRAVRTVGTYKSYLNSFTDYLTEKKLHSLSVTDFTPYHYQQYIIYKNTLGHGNGNINDHTTYIKSLFQKIKSFKLIQENPLEEIQQLTESDSSLFEPFTPEELILIKQTLIEKNIDYCLYTMFCAHEFMRPHHIARLQAGAINYNNNTIRITIDTSKGKRNAVKQLMQPVTDMLIATGRHTLPGHWYLFGKDFQPSETLFPSLSNRSAEAWKKYVIEGLGINKKQYALKHTSGQFYAQENESPDMMWLQKQMEHHSIRQTEVYLQNRVVKRIDENRVKLLPY